jgi:hypothetical protein
MGKGHIILGETTDYLTGKVVAETHDEQARQRIAKLLVEEKGYPREEILSRQVLPVTVDGRTENARIDFVLRVKGVSCAVVLYGPGSLVTRQKPAVAAALLIESYRIPVAVVTNGIDAQIIDTRSGKVTGEGLDAIPSRETALAGLAETDLSPVPENRREKARRILYAMDILTEKECDDSCEIC